MNVQRRGPGKTFHRHGTGIRIDHIFVARETDSNTPYLTRGIVVRSYATLRKTEWVILSNHRPVQVELDILGMGMQRPSKHERNREDKVSAQANVDLTNKEKIGQYQEILRTSVAHLLHGSECNSEPSGDTLLEIATLAGNDGQRRLEPGICSIKM